MSRQNIVLELQENGNHGAHVAGRVALERGRECGNARVEFFAQMKKRIRQKAAKLDVVRFRAPTRNGAFGCARKPALFLAEKSMKQRSTGIAPARTTTPYTPRATAAR